MKSKTENWNSHSAKEKHVQVPARRKKAFTLFFARSHSESPESVKCEPLQPGQGEPELQTCIMHSETHHWPAGCDERELLNQVTQRPELTHRLAESILSKSLTAEELAFYSWTHICTKTIKENVDAQDGEMPISDFHALLLTSRPEVNLLWVHSLHASGSSCPQLLILPMSQAQLHRPKALRAFA